MGNFYVDDLFFDHPKALAAGEDAANLFVRGLAWAHRHNTGLIPKAAIDTLTRKKGVRALASKLVEVFLWHDEGDHYRIHDWETRNAKSIARREQSQSAAKERWRRHSERNADASDTVTRNPHNGITTAAESETANSAAIAEVAGHAKNGNLLVWALQAHADASVSHDVEQCVSNADAMPYQPRNQGTKEPRNVKPPPPSLSVVGPADSAAADFVAEVVEIVANRQLVATMLRQPVHSRSGWLTVARRNLTALHGPSIAAAQAFGETAQAVADRLEPPPAPARIYDLERPECELCGGSGWTDDEPPRRCEHRQVVTA